MFVNPCLYFEELFPSAGADLTPDEPEVAVRAAEEPLSASGEDVSSAEEGATCSR